MPLLSEEITIPSPPEVVWPLLSDPALVASCIPGATLTPSLVAGVYQGTVRVKFGPTVAIFRGEARLAYDHEARRCTVDGRGIDGRGQSRALAAGVVSAGGDRETVLKVEGSFNVTGPLETFANAGGIHVARALLAEFAVNLAALLTDEGTPAPDAEAIPIVEPQTASMQARTAAVQGAVPGAVQGAVPGAAAVEAAPPAPALRGEALLWRVFLAWLRQLFSGKGQRESR